MRQKQQPRCPTEARILSAASIAFRVAGRRSAGDDDTSYVACDTPGDLDFYALTDLGFVPDAVHAAQLTMCARKDDAETREVRLKLKSGAVTEDGATQAMASSDQYLSDVYEEDPDAEGPWTASSVNAMQIGLETVT